MADMAELSSVSHWVIITLINLGAAWGGARYALSAQGKKIEEHQRVIDDIRGELTDLATIDDVDKVAHEVKELAEKNASEIRLLVPFLVCREKQRDCFESKKDANEEILRRIDILAIQISTVEQKREKGKDERNAAISDLAKQIAVLENTIRERSYLFRKEDKLHGKNEPTEPSWP